MGWLLSLRILVACAVAAPWAATEAAEITRVVSSGDEESPFGLDVSIRWDHTLRRGKITREVPSTSGTGVTDELQYQRITNALVPRIAVGLYRDLELHAEMPYVVADEQGWRYSALPQLPGQSTIEQNGIDANGLACSSVPCRIFPVPATTYQAGLGDLKLGLAWAILSDKRDDTGPSWLVGIDVTLPTAERYDPYTSLAHPDRSRAAPVGQKVWAFDLHTALSRRMGALDPYLKAHVRIPSNSGATYSNCEHAADLAGTTPASMTSIAAANCANSTWKDEAGAKPPTVVGLLFGTEIVSAENRQQTARVAFDVRVGAEYVSGARWFNELSDATQKLLQTERYLTLSGLVALHLRATRYLQLHASAAFEHDFAHLLTGENLGPSGNDGSVVGTPQQNPNFDWRYDLPGRRFRIENTTVLTVTVVAAASF